MQCSCGQEMIEVCYRGNYTYIEKIFKYPKNYGKESEVIGKLVCCPKCGTLKVEIDKG